MKKLTQKELTHILINSDKFKAKFLRHSANKLINEARYYAGKYVNLLNFCNGENKPVINLQYLDTGQIKKVQQSRFNYPTEFISTCNDVKISGTYKNGKFEFIIFHFCADMIQLLNISQAN